MCNVSVSLCVLEKGITYIGVPFPLLTTCVQKTMGQMLYNILFMSGAFNKCNGDMKKQIKHSLCSYHG